jgi:hypothetical protein
LHDGTRAVAAGTRRVWNTSGGPDDFELAVTTIHSGGGVRWIYGTNHGMHSAPLLINGQPTGFWLSALVRWGPYLAIGGFAGTQTGGGFVTIRNLDGSVLPPGTNAVVQLPAWIESLEAMPNGSLDATFRDMTDLKLKKRRLVMAPGLTIDTTFGTTILPEPPGGITLPDGSTIRARWQFQSNSDRVEIWVDKERRDGSIDTAFGGTRKSVSTSPFPRFDTLEARLLSLTSGDYVLVALIRVKFLPALVSEPAALIAAAWLSSDGAPMWRNVFEDRTVTAITQAFFDPPDGIIAVGSRGAAKGFRAPFLQRILVKDGDLDRRFGRNGLLTVALRSDRRPDPARNPEFQTARPILDQAGGAKLVPVIFESSESDPIEAQQRKALTFAWLDIT